MTVNMPVEAINEKCIGCPELDIDIRTLELYGTDPSDEKLIQICGYENTLRCAHVDRCRMVMNYQKPDAPEKKAPSKKPASKTTNATTAKKKT